VDARVKPAHDDLRLVLLKIEQPISFPGQLCRKRGEGGNQSEYSALARGHDRGPLSIVAAALI
jgi:hypothetical protein